MISWATIYNQKLLNDESFDSFWLEIEEIDKDIGSWFIKVESQLETSV